MVSVAELVDYIDHFSHRLMQDALAEATAEYWRRRAQQFAEVGTPACDEISKACWARSHVALLGGEDLVVGDGEDQVVDHLGADRGVQR